MAEAAYTSQSPSSTEKVEVTPELVESVLATLLDVHKPVAERNRAIFTLRNIGGEAAVNAFARALEVDHGALLRHEVAFALGQMQDPLAIPVLERLLRDEQENSMVRHEAGEALGAIGEESSLEILSRYEHDPCIAVAETCQLALDRIRWYKQKREEQGSVESISKFFSVDPAPPLSTSLSVAELKAILMNESKRMFERYGAMFALRDIGSEDAAAALGCAFSCSSALLKHEIAYVLGQLQHPVAVDPLLHVLKNKDEHCMVRHEAAEALGTIPVESVSVELRHYLNSKDEDPVVRESCAVALDMADYYTSSSFEYADGLTQAG